MNVKDRKKLKIKVRKEQEKTRKLFQEIYKLKHEKIPEESIKADFNKLISLSSSLSNILNNLDSLVRLFVSKQKDGSLKATTDQEFNAEWIKLNNNKNKNGCLSEKYINGSIKDASNTLKKFKKNVSNVLLKDFTNLEMHEFNSLFSIASYFGNLKPALNDRDRRLNVANTLVQVKNDLVRFLARCEKVLFGEEGLLEEYMPEEISEKLSPVILKERDMFESNFMDQKLEVLENALPEELSYDLDLFTIVVRNLINNARLGANPDYNIFPKFINQFDDNTKINYQPIKVTANYYEDDFPHFRIKVENSIANPDAFKEKEVYQKIKNGQKVTTKKESNDNNGTFLKVLRKLLSRVNYSNLNREEDFMKVRLFKYRDPSLLGEEKFASNNLIQVTSSDIDSLNFNPEHFSIEIIYPLGNVMELTN